jgi:uncharacterized damage-inducible protein DinB
MFTSMTAFVRYFEGIRERTLRFIEAIPPEQIDFARHPGKFSLGDLIRHIAATETMFVEVALDGRWVYRGHGRELGATKAEAVAHLAAVHAAAMARLAEAGDAALQEKRPTPDGYPVSAWRILMLMTEHEIHHRSQISQSLVDLGVEPPQIFGKSLEELPQAFRQTGR